MRRLLIAATLLLAAPLVAAQAYKWTDAKGTVHYSDAPPAQGTKYSKVTTTGTVEPIAAPTSAPPPEGGVSEAHAGAPAKPMADTPENRTKFCASLKGNLELLKGDGTLVMQDGGQQKVMDADQRKQQQATAEAQYQQYCAGN
jgi:hypothetical protein